MIVPWQDLSSEALAGVIEEYVTRDGTELSESTEKAVQVRAALDRGDLVLVFDAEFGSTNLLAPDEVPTETRSDDE